MYSRLYLKGEIEKYTLLTYIISKARIRLITIPKSTFKTGTIVNSIVNIKIFITTARTVFKVLEAKLKLFKLAIISQLLSIISS